MELNSFGIKAKEIIVFSSPYRPSHFTLNKTDRLQKWRPAGTKPLVDIIEDVIEGVLELSYTSFRITYRVKLKTPQHRRAPIASQTNLCLNRDTRSKNKSIDHQTSTTTSGTSRTTTTKKPFLFDIISDGTMTTAGEKKGHRSNIIFRRLGHILHPIQQ